ncbi:hypothetical protein [Nocardia aurantia]|uniref:DUF8020 domain-containing protein n=1 Tax=Nocardia aurantia TaxID=2585199 RepID=A0A7K0DZJ0_9NOCA|nr:hypothetical protein [Nocardia aurantia]MQY30947.1 hypothetical protein [Nocardia aurantia]
MHYTTTGLATLVAAITITGAPAQAQPGPAGQVRVALDGHSVILTLDNTRFARADEQVAVVDGAGATVTTIPTAIEVNQQRFALSDSISGDARTLTLTPDLPAITAAHLVPVASPMEEQLAMDQLAADLNSDTFSGLLLGALVGSVVGLGLGLASCLVTGPACLAVVPAAASAFATGGGVVGTLVGGGAALAGSGWKYLLTIQSPPGQSPYADQDRALGSGGTGVPDATPRIPSGFGAGLSSGSSS